MRGDLNRLLAEKTNVIIQQFYGDSARNSPNYRFIAKSKSFYILIMGGMMQWLEIIFGALQ
jgi:hypothetical protein